MRHAADVFCLEQHDSAPRERERMRSNCYGCEGTKGLEKSIEFQDEDGEQNMKEEEDRGKKRKEKKKIVRTKRAIEP